MSQHKNQLKTTPCSMKFMSGEYGEYILRLQEFNKESETYNEAPNKAMDRQTDQRNWRHS